MIPASDPRDQAPLDTRGIRGAQVLLACDTLEPSLSFFTGRLGFRVDAIFPADDPATAMVSGHGLQLRLVRGATGGATTLYLLCDDPLATGAGSDTLVAPNGVVVRLVAADPPMRVPATRQALVVTRAGADDHWGVGRAGLRYRDLLPERHGGAFIASHIRVLEGGPVPDYVHFHKIRFQAIFCRKGWVRVVYEGQGAPFVMQAGDCVLQPPLIRHRVLESSAGAEVVEIGAPAEHITMADHTLELPMAELQPERDFSGQRFVRHVAAQAAWQPWRIAGFEAQDTGIGAATHGLAGIRVVRPSRSQGRPQNNGTPLGDPAQQRLGATSPTAAPVRQIHDTEFCFYFVLSGAVTLRFDDQSPTLHADDSITVPGGMPYALVDAGPDLTVLEITLPAVFPLQQAPAPTTP